MAIRTAVKLDKAYVTGYIEGRIKLYEHLQPDLPHQAKEITGALDELKAILRHIQEQA